jgi:hypothetical protein
VHCTNGIQFSFQNLLGINPQTVGIVVSGYRDSGITSASLAFYGLTKGTHSISGSIVINTPTFVHSNYPVYYSASWDHSLTVTINTPVTIL